MFLSSPIEMERGILQPGTMEWCLPRPIDNFSSFGRSREKSGVKVGLLAILEPGHLLSDTQISGDCQKFF